MEEKTLISKLKKGNPKAVNYWFNTYNGRLLAVVLSKVSDKQDAEEIVQQTFLNCLKHLPLFMARSSIWTWMNSIAHHEIADYFRKKYAKKESCLINIIIQSEISQKVRSVINKMKDYYGELLMLKYVDGKKVSAIAKELGRSIKSVESDLFRARNEFRSIWQE